MDYDKLKLILRNDFNKIRPLYLKEKCECCGTSESLHVHHDKSFVSILKETLDKLELEVKDHYDEREVYLIRACMLYEQCHEHYYKTLCFECHQDYHSENGREKIKSPKTNNPEKEVKKLKELKELKEFIETYRNEELDKLEREKLLAIINQNRTKSRNHNVKIYNGKIKSITNIDKYLFENFGIHVKSKRKRVKGKWSTFWYFE